MTDERGSASFAWTPSADSANLLRLTVEGSPAPVAEASALTQPPRVTAAGVVNAASFQAGLTPGGIASLFGAGLTNARVSVNGNAAIVFFTSDRQLNFLAPAALAAGTASLSVQTVIGQATATGIPVTALQPGIFFDAGSGRAAAIDRGQGIFELYGTGFGATDAAGLTNTAVTAEVGGQPATVLYSGQAPGFPGLYQINLQVPAGIPAGDQTIVLIAGGLRSNSVTLPVR